MTTKNNESTSQVLPQGDNAAVSAPQAVPPEHQTSRARNQVFKSGPLFISSKGIGWTSWKKRWFVLTRTSLVFYRSDPSTTPQKAGEVNLTLGGIDLNNSASVEVKTDKKLLTVLFPDGRDGRTFTLKAETLEDLNEWKTALENAVQLAPSATNVAGQNGGLPNNEQADVANGSTDQQKDKPPITSMVIGRPILLALEDIDGSPSFLEKALRYIEDHGLKVEGILRQAADVDEVHRRVREYEQGKTEFSSEEDAHVIGDCIKYILRELPSSPVPASCCNALLDAFRSDRNNRLNAMRTAILETFPEPNRRLLQRILLMMQTIASNKAVNRMSTSAVAACMSPLLLRPLLAGDCELENTHMDVAGDGSLQLLQAAAAANHAQAIIITLLDEYDNIFGEGSASAELFSDSDESGSETDDGTYDEDDDDYLDDDEDHDYASDDHDEETDEDYEHSLIETCSESSDHAESDSCDEKPSRSSSFTESPARANNPLAKQRSPSSSPLSPMPRKDNRQGDDDNPKRNNDRSASRVDDISKSHRHANVDTGSENESASSSSPRVGGKMSSTKNHGGSQVKRPRWGRTTATRNLSMESIEFSVEDEDDEIKELEAAKVDLQNRIVEEENGNAVLRASLERRKKSLHERRLALEKDVSRLQEQLQKEKDLRAALEAGPKISQLPSSRCISEKTKNDLQEFAIEEENFNNLKQRYDDLGQRLSHEHEHNAALLRDRELEIQGALSQQTSLIYNRDCEIKGTTNHVERSNKDDECTVEGDSCEWNSELRLSNKNQNQPNDTSRGGLPKLGRNNSPSSEPPVTKPSPSTFKKSSSKGDGGNTTSALSKLTNRLNFLKERRSQIAHELQFIDKSKVFSLPPILSPGKGKAPELPVNHGIDNQNKDDRRSQSSQSSTEGDKDNKNKSDNKQSSISRSDATSSYSYGKGTPNEDEKSGDSKDSNKKSENKRNSTSTSDATSSYSFRRGMSNEGEKTGDNKDIKGDNKSSSSHSLEKRASIGGEKIEGDNKDSNEKNDTKSSSDVISDAPSSYSSRKGASESEKMTEGDNKDSNQKRDDRNQDTLSSYNSGKGMWNEGDNKDSIKKSDKKSKKDRNKKSDKKESNKKGSSSKSDAFSSQSSVKAVSTESDRNDDKRKTENKDDSKKGNFSSKTDPCPWQSLDEMRKSENQSSQHLDRVKSEAQSTRSSDKSREQDTQQSSTSRMLSR